MRKMEHRSAATENIHWSLSPMLNSKDDAPKGENDVGAPPSSDPRDLGFPPKFAEGSVENHLGDAFMKGTAHMASPSQALVQPTAGFLPEKPTTSIRCIKPASCRSHADPQRRSCSGLAGEATTPWCLAAPHPSPGKAARAAPLCEGTRMPPPPPATTGLCQAAPRGSGGGGGKVGRGGGWRRRLGFPPPVASRGREEKTCYSPKAGSRYALLHRRRGNARLNTSPPVRTYTWSLHVSIL